MAFLTFITQDAAVETGIRLGGGIDADEQGEEGGRDSEAHDVKGLVDVVIGSACSDM